MIWPFVRKSLWVVPGILVAFALAQQGRLVSEIVDLPKEALSLAPWLDDIHKVLVLGAIQSLVLLVLVIDRASASGRPGFKEATEWARAQSPQSPPSRHEG